MRIINDRDLRNMPGKVRQALAQGEVVVASRGKPYAIMLPISDPERVEEALELAARIRAQMAVSSVRAKAAASGLDRLSEEEIEAEIRAAREERRSRQQ